MRVLPDDEVYRVNTVWLGPNGLTFPWTARYLAYATWLVTFLAVLLVEAVTPLDVGIPPVWELCLTTLFTYGVMGLVDHERPIGSVWGTFRSDLTAPRGGDAKRRSRAQFDVRVRDDVRGRPKHDDVVRLGQEAVTVTVVSASPAASSLPKAGRRGRKRKAAVVVAEHVPAARPGTDLVLRPEVPPTAGRGA